MTHVKDICFLILLSCFSFVSICNAWDSTEMQMFDLVEDLDMNFYDFLGITKDASQAEIKRAYRRLSMKMHPDKNVGDPTAEDKFRQLVGVYEVLKDDERRHRYDEVLEHGLPDWRMPVFYFRKLRKMSNTELGLIVSVLCTTIHYAALWATRIERSWTLEEQLSTAYKRHKARDKKREMIDIEINERLNEIPRPKWHDILPFAIIKFIYYMIISIPDIFVYMKNLIWKQVDEKLQQHRELREEREAKEQLQLIKQNRKNKLRSERVPETSPYDASTLLSLYDLPTEVSETKPINEEQTTKSTLWSEDDLVKLVHAIAQFPGGCPGRWERIAAKLDRSVSDVTSKSKELGELRMAKYFQNSQSFNEIPQFETNENAVCGETSEEEEHDTDEDEQFLVRRRNKRPPTNTTTEDVQNNSNDEQESNEIVTVDEPYMSRKKLKAQALQQKKSEEDSEQSGLADGWTQAEQKQLEVAIRSIGKDIPERWERIAECVPTKSKAEVMQRVKHISTLIKSKKPRA